MQGKTKKVTTVSMLCALSYVVMLVGRFPLIPAVSFLKYDPKDVIIVIGGFLFGPLTAFLISVVVSLVEMVTVSGTGPIGLVMNILSTAAFACPAAWIYKKDHTLRGGLWGLLLGVCSMVAVMLLWNYGITPLYMKIPREQVAGMLLPVFLPFNLLKGALNAALTMVLYKPVSRVLKKAGMMPTPEQSDKETKWGVWLMALLVFASCFLLLFIIK